MVAAPFCVTTTHIASLVKQKEEKHVRAVACAVVVTAASNFSSPCAAMHAS
jgi:hypothetical protein